MQKFSRDSTGIEHRLVHLNTPQEENVGPLSDRLGNPAEVRGKLNSLNDNLLRGAFDRFSQPRNDGFSTVSPWQSLRLLLRYKTPLAYIEKNANPLEKEILQKGMAGIGEERMENIIRKMGGAGKHAMISLIGSFSPSLAESWDKMGKRHAEDKREESELQEGEHGASYLMTYMGSMLRRVLLSDPNDAATLYDRVDSLFHTSIDGDLLTSLTPDERRDFDLFTSQAADHIRSNRDTPPFQQAREKMLNAHQDIGVKDRIFEAILEKKGVRKRIDQITQEYEWAMIHREVSRIPSSRAEMQFMDERGELFNEFSVPNTRPTASMLIRFFPNDQSKQKRFVTEILPLLGRRLQRNGNEITLKNAPPDQLLRILVMMREHQIR